MMLVIRLIVIVFLLIQFLHYCISATGCMMWLRSELLQVLVITEWHVLAFVHRRMHIGFLYCISIVLTASHSSSWIAGESGDSTTRSTRGGSYCKKEEKGIVSQEEEAL